MDGLRIYNSMTGMKEPFKPVSNDDNVGIYVCGPTVQSAPHIGHMRSGVVFDNVRRWMQVLGYNVHMIMNITDIDDKILNKSRETGIEWRELAYSNERVFMDAYDALRIQPPSVLPHATGNIHEIIEFIQQLIDTGHAYTLDDGNVYFDVNSWPEYGKLTHQNADSMHNSASNDDNGKHNPADFALWKAPKDTDPVTAVYDAPFGAGRPGWHIECSTMSHKHLDGMFDIHGGGLDLRFPHHENEIAQTEAAGYKTANIWMHSYWVTSKGEKMSKSLGNGLSMQSLQSAGHADWAIRYMLSSVNYRHMLEFDDSVINNADMKYKRFKSILTHASILLHDNNADIDDSSMKPDLEVLPKDFTDAMNDDFNVSMALSIINQHVNGLERLMASDNASIADIRSNTIIIRMMLGVLGLDMMSDEWQHDDSVNIGSSMPDSISRMDDVVNAINDYRNKLRADGRYDEADSLRSILIEAGINVNDNKVR